MSILFFAALPERGTAQRNRIADEIAAQAGAFASIKAESPLTRLTGAAARRIDVSDAVEKATVYRPDLRRIQSIIRHRPAFLVVEIPVSETESLSLRLKRADVLTPEFRVVAASDPGVEYPYVQGANYWGVIDGQANSLVALSFTQDELMGFVQSGDRHYTLGRLDSDMAGTHILYETDDLKRDPGVNCFTDDSHRIGKGMGESTGHRYNANNCVRMYIEVDYDIFVGKGGVQQAADYVNGAFSQVSILYANESVDLVVNEILVWDVVDPYTGPTTSNYLTQFRNYLNGNYNGDLAHLVGYTGGGGIAYLDVLCNGYYGVGYSDINSTYANVPTYSWTVEVLTHEIGHNLGSSHTHACVWNGNNTAIDGCGPTAGYSEGNCPVGPLPANGGTIMSYCHLVGGVGINFNNGFGPQPGDRIRSEVYNAACLTPCSSIQHDAGITAIAEPADFPCEATSSPVVTLSNFGSSTLTGVMIKYRVDAGTVASYAWTGALASGQGISVTLPTISYAAGTHTFTVWTELPNGQPDETPSNDQSQKNFEYIVGYCDCNACVTAMAPNPLTHSGSGSSAASVTFDPGSKNPALTISGLNAKVNGPTQNRFNEAVTVTYVNGNGQTVNYGTFYGAQQSAVEVTITGFVNNITVTLSNALNNGYSGTLSVSFSPVDFCAPDLGCPDSDCDGICDSNDECPQLDNSLIGTPCDDGDPCTSNDVYVGGSICGCAGTPVPDCCPNPALSPFSPNPLNHVGGGSTTSQATLPASHGDAAFTVSNLNARVNGPANKRFIDRVTITYRIAAGGPVIQYGVFQGDQVSTVDVSIPGPVHSIAVALDDAYDGNTGSETISVSMTSVESCPVSATVSGPSSPDVAAYPNPATDELTIRIDGDFVPVRIDIHSATGVLLGTQAWPGMAAARFSLRTLGAAGTQMVFVSVISASGERIVRPVWVMD